MKIDPQNIWKDIRTIKEHSPLIHNITNYVVMEQTANSLLAIGASPVMAHAVEEAEDMAMIASGLVLNIGTLSSHWIDGMMLAHKAANCKGIPVVLDPVGAGATPYRTEKANSILNNGTLAAIRGNASEIAAFNNLRGKPKGVDSSLNASDHVEAAKSLALKNKCIVWMSGKTDIITDGHHLFLINNGHPLMGKVTGMGCTSTAITAAFLAVNQNHLLGVSHAAILMGIAGELAAKKADGPGSFKLAFTDVLYNISLHDLKLLMRAEMQ